MPKKKEDSSKVRVGGAKDRFWVPRFWDGMNLSGWCRLITRNGFRVTPSRVVMAMIVTGTALLNLPLTVLQSLFFGRRIREAELVDAPIFIVGHWRSGTTLLHEYMVRDTRYTYPDTYACFCPNHFLLSRHFLRPALSILMPKRRPVDNMAVGWDRPQEDEFALCNLGVHSPYLWLAFPNNPRLDQEYLDLRDVPPEGLAKWKDGMLRFLKYITVANRKRIVLKSPPHTCRVRTLREMFPGAKFIHIHRDPYDVFPSTMNLWKRLSTDQGFQKPNPEGWESYVLDTFRHMYEVFEEDRGQLDASEIIDISYDDLVADPVGQLEKIYGQLELGDFEPARAAVENFAAGQKDYKKNRFHLADEIRDRITESCGPYMENYGYGK